MTTTQPTSSAATGAALSPPHADALVTALSGEQAAVYAYGLVGAQGGTSARGAARTRLAAHAVRRDLLAGRLSAAARRPPVAEPAYAMPFEVDSAVTARALAAHVESGLAAVYADLVAAAPADRRVEAADWLTEAAVAALAWGGGDVPFPGLPERAPTA